MSKLKKIGLALLVLLVVGQFFRPAKNQSDDQSRHLSTVLPFPAEVEQIIRPGCYDCHSNHTEYPWYAEIQPIAWWLAGHVKNGKKELNFSEFASRRAAIRNKKLEEIIEQVKEGDMPLKSYTWLHPAARLTPEQRGKITAWAQGMQDTMRARFPVDSLVLRRR